MLIVRKMSYGSATSLPLVSPGLSHWIGTSFNLLPSQNTPTSRFFDWKGVDGSSNAKGIEITNNNRVYVNSSDNNNNPSHVRVNNGSWASDVPISANDTVNFSHDGSSVLITWVVQASQLWTVSSGGSTPSTLSTADTASFAGTVPQQIQWAITNGSSPVANSNYSLFNESPGGTALGVSINLGSNPQVGATQTVTYINPTGADFTGKWYIGYGQGATRVNLKVYDFSSSGKVFCNFW